MPTILKKLLPLLLMLLPAANAAQPLPRLTPDQLQWLGGQIYNNECSQRPTCLTAWNEGEDFPSLGIGHFIWYRSGQQEAFEESFPSLLAFMQDQGVKLPDWLAALDFNSPWPDRPTFLAEFDTPRMKQLRDFLQAHMDVQTAFIVQRFENALEPMLAHSPARSRIERNFHRVAQTSPPYGLYALIDYINFKGEGIAETERYQDQGWGLLQVLDNMAADEQGNALLQFVESARAILEKRVQNAPAQRNEARWLAGWRKRLETYLPESAAR